VSKRWRSILWFALGAAAIFALGAYGASIGSAERGSFVMSFPATGTVSGGPSANKLTGSITVPINSAGWLKRVLQASVIQIASHSIRNVGDTPRSIRIETVGFPKDTEWGCRDLSWDPVTHTVTRMIAPGQAVDLDLVVPFPKPLPDNSTLLNGRIVVYDAVTREWLSTLPVRVVQDGASIITTGTCCE
jgi:hypothetical protein